MAYQEAAKEVMRVATTCTLRTRPTMKKHMEQYHIPIRHSIALMKHMEKEHHQAVLMMKHKEECNITIRFGHNLMKHMQ